MANQTTTSESSTATSTWSSDRGRSPVASLEEYRQVVREHANYSLRTAIKDAEGCCGSETALEKMKGAIFASIWETMHVDDPKRAGAVIRFSKAPLSDDLFREMILCCGGDGIANVLEGEPFAAMAVEMGAEKLAQSHAAALLYEDIAAVLEDQLDVTLDYRFRSV